MEALCCHPLAKGPSAVAGRGAGAWVWPEAMAAHVGGSHPVAAMVRAASSELGQVGLKHRESVGPGRPVCRG